MNFFYDELNKQAQINAVLDDNENPETQEAIVGTFQNPEELVGNIMRIQMNHNLFMVN